MLILRTDERTIYVVTSDSKIVLDRMNINIVRSNGEVKVLYTAPSEDLAEKIYDLLWTKISDGITCVYISKLANEISQSSANFFDTFYQE